MKVQGQEITEAQIRAGLNAMGGRFTFRNVVAAMIRAGVDHAISDRAADRLLQAERRAGRIRFRDNGTWTRVS
jgi:hypothetical protein